MNEEQGFETMVELGVVLDVADVERALSFYCDFLGFEFVRDEDDPGQERRIATVRYGNVVLDLVEGSTTDKRQNYRLIWSVEKLDDAIEHICAGGGSVVRRMEYGVYCSDPDGYVFLVNVLDMSAEQAQEMFF